VIGGDTIAALATPRGAGGIAVIRVSGPDAVALIAAIVGRAPSSLPDRRLVRGEARGRDGGRLDEVLVVVMRGPRSFTGEDVAELHGHGGTVNAGRLLREVVERGARLAEPGEFTRRAFENGRLDLSAAEGLLGVIEAASERAWRVAQSQLAGALGARVAEERTSLTELLAEIEACIDFPEEGLALIDQAAVSERARAMSERCERLAGTFRLGRVLRDGIEVALVGPVNAGKSSLFNILVGRERALVAPDPGTTRDYVEARVEWDGIAVTLIDTAGERVDATAIEERGIALGRERVAQVDVKVWVDDTSTPSAIDDRTILVRSKIDQGGEVPAEVIGTSAVTGAGIEALRARILSVAGASSEQDDAVVVTSERQRGLLERGAGALRAAAGAAAAGQSPELVAVEVRDALSALAAITGEAVGEDVLDALFARFCIGK
jgi:tRNA modification GTPase